VVTSGPGATNMITGICGAWFDSIACMFISGQVNTFEQRAGREARQVGFQETDIVDIVRPITKYAVKVERADDIRVELERATYIAREGRPGPVLIDIPLDLQRAEIDVETLPGFTPPAKPAGPDPATLRAQVGEALQMLAGAERPVLLVGGGVRIAQAEQEIALAARGLGIPIVTSWSGFDLVPFADPLHVGQFGVYGSRAANYAVQNCDVLLSVGSRLDTRQTGGEPGTFARGAKKIVVDIDASEVHKGRGLEPDLAIVSDAKTFLEVLLAALPDAARPDVDPWIERTQEWKQRYPTVLPQYYAEQPHVNPYVFIKTLSEELDEGAVVVTDCGGNLTYTLQGFEVKPDQRIVSSFGNSPMGYSLAGSIGATLGLNQDVVCIIGDGGMQVNIQELQTIMHYQLPIKIFLMNNHTYGIIQQFQDMYMGSEHVASGDDGYTVPDFIAITRAYGIEAFTVHAQENLREGIRRALQTPGPVLCEIVLPDETVLSPKLEFGNPIEDQAPLLPREEFRSNMIVPPLTEARSG